MQKSKKRWSLCPTCFQLIYTNVNTLGQHRCPDPIRAKHAAELDMAVDDAFENWDKDVEKFWKSKDVKFWTYLLKTKRQI